MQGKKHIESDFLTHLRNFEPQIAQFSIKTGVYGEALLSYFRVCPYAQDLATNWNRISQELSNVTSGRTPPQWSCSNYNKCNHNEHCRPPFRWEDTQHQYFCVIDSDYSSFVTETGRGRKNHTIRKSNIGKLLIEDNSKVLASPVRLDKVRSDCQYSEDQVANMCGLSKQSISNLNFIPENPKQKLSCIAAKNGMVSIKYSLCCLLAVLYEVTPGYLMGQSDEPSRDIYVHKCAYYQANKFYQDNFESSVKASPPIHEEYEISPGLIAPIELFSKKKAEGRKAADRMRKHFKDLAPNFQILLELCEKIYYQPIPLELQRDLHLLFEGLLDSANTTAAAPGIREIVQPPSPPPSPLQHRK